MQQRGRKSSAALSVVQTGEIEAIQRPEPPEHLTDEQIEVWTRVVNNLPADWIGEDTTDHLAQYCRHVINARRLAVMIEELMKSGSDDWIDDYDKLLKMQERESRAMTALARSMRITQQATYDPKKKRSGGAGVKRPF